MDASRSGLELKLEEQRVGVGAGAGEEVASARGGASELGANAGKWIKSSGAGQGTGSNRGKFSHRSQSSPSSLTTHKFGLRPTPSPPRLIIDHQTGDIIESYPQQPVYLRTYQPVDDNEEGEGENEEEEEDPITEVSEDSQVVKQRRQLDEYKRLLRHQQRRQQNPNHHQGLDEGFLSSQDELHQTLPIAEMNNRQYRPTIPPPHTGKVYFAPPSVSGSAHLFGLPPSRQESFDGELEVEPQVNQHQLNQNRPNLNQSGSHNQSFKRALNKLNDATRTDIAILEPRGGDTGHRHGSPSPSKQQQQIKVTATSASRANALLQANNKTRDATTVQVEPVIEHFRLYDIGYQFRALLVMLLSSLIVYLLVVPLYADCARHRPTLTYLSLILASVNLTCILVFSLFWYCSGVTRTLYANLSSSAFIITIYSILVALNLALGVLFFFTNTCHFQKLVDTPLALALASNSNYPLSSLQYSPAEGATSAEERIIIRRHDHSSFTNYLEQEEPIKREKRSTLNEDEATLSGQVLLEASSRHDTSGAYMEDEPASPLPLLAPNMSPLEAAWEWSCEQIRALRRHFRHFLIRYDLRFIGALHALCAICLQYMAMKVAVVRSHFCSPIAHYL